MRRSRQPQRIDTQAGDADALGNTALLCAVSLALICSQKCPGDVILRTYDFARLVRGSGRAIVSGFHSPIEKDCLPILLRGPDPVIIVQAHRLSTTRLPLEWQKAIDAGRLLLLSPFDERHKRVTAELAWRRNRFVANIAEELLVAHAQPGSKTEALCRELIAGGKPVYTFNDPANQHLISMGAQAVKPGFFAREKPSGANDSFAAQVSGPTDYH
jgi:predicted Rossmann fold nucleotide-binding protein DprA/Smf involved in DNA uptake